MFNLRIIKCPKSLGGDYLGIASGNLLELRDNDPVIHTLLPYGSGFTPSVTAAYRGRKRLILTNYSGTCLIMIRSSHSLEGIPQAELYIYAKNGNDTHSDILADVRTLASYRWPSGILFITRTSLKKMAKDLPFGLMTRGWKDLRSETGKRAFELVLPKPMII